MPNGVKGPGSGPGPAPVTNTNIGETKKADTPSAPPEKKEEAPKPQGPAGRSAEGLAHDPAVAMRKAALSKTAGLKTPTKAQLEEIRSAIKDGKKEEAIKLTIKYYNIDTSGAHEVKYVPGKKEEAHAPEEHQHFKEIGTGTHNRNGKISIEIGDESFQFKGKDSPEWLAAAIFHESFHAKNHFKPDKPRIVNEPPERAQQGKMSQQEIAEEIQAYFNEQKAGGKLGLSEEMLAEINDRRNKLYRQLNDENREILTPILRGTKDWPK